MSALLKKIEQIEVEKKEAAKALWRKFAEQLAAGDEDPELSEVSEALTLNGKTSADLTREVQDIKRRNSLLAEVRAGEDAAEERAKILRDIEAAEKEFAPLKEEHNQRVVSMHMRYRDLESTVNHAANARSELLRSCSADTTNQLNSIRRQVEQLNLCVDEKKKQTASIEANIRAAGGRAGDSNQWQKGDQRTSNDPQAVKQGQVRLVKANKELAELESQRTELNARQDAIVAELWGQK